MSHRALVITIACLALVALALRVVRLDDRPPHTDEAVNAWILGRVLAGDAFAFDPRDRHGPLLPAAGLVVATILGRRSFADLDERTIRLAPAIIGAAATGMFALGAGLIPNGVLASSAALWALSPLPIYYARYGIHETLLVAATLLFLLALARACVAGEMRPRLGWAGLAGFAAGTMVAAKLTALVPLSVAVIALGVSWFSAGLRGRARPQAEPRSGSSLAQSARPEASPYPGIAAFALTSLVACTLAYSWGFTRFAGLHDLVFGLGEPLSRAAGQGHEKGPFYFLGILGHGAFGILFLLAALAGALLAWHRGGAVGRALVIYAAGLLLVHSAIPYKTPWLALGLFLPLATLAAWAIAWALKVGRALRARSDDAITCAARSERAPYLRAAIYAGLAAFAAVTVHADYRLVYSEPATEANPLAYAHTSPDLRRLGTLVDSLPGREPLIAVSLADPWPLPFLLRREARVGYWQPGNTLPEDADLVITAVDDIASLDVRFASWRPHYFSQRPGVMLVALQNPGTEVAP